MSDLFKPLYKQHRRADMAALAGEVFDPLSAGPAVRVHGYTLEKSRWVGARIAPRTDDPTNAEGAGDRAQWTCAELPGLRIISAALSEREQARAVRASVKDYLESSEHLTNLDAHYALARPLRLFGAEPSRLPDKRDSLVADKLRWVTLGGQYNWTTKEYPSFEPGTPGCPRFPATLAAYIAEAFGVAAEAAIVNYYGDGDILSPHRDVAELSGHDLVSISLGCACVFYIGADRLGAAPLPLLLRSGDVVVMGGASRHAFHGVGRVFADTAPSALCAAPDMGDGYADWMHAHRININVRQMR